MKRAFHSTLHCNHQVPQKANFKNTVQNKIMLYHLHSTDQPSTHVSRRLGVLHPAIRSSTSHLANTQIFQNGEQNGGQTAAHHQSTKHALPTANALQTRPSALHPYRHQKPRTTTRRLTMSPIWRTKHRRDWLFYTLATIRYLAVSGNRKARRMPKPRCAQRTACHICDGRRDRAGLSESRGWGIRGLGL